MEWPAHLSLVRGGGVSIVFFFFFFFFSVFVPPSIETLFVLLHLKPGQPSIFVYFLSKGPSTP